MTKRQLIILRAETYKGPQQMRCETCQHASRYGNNCLAIEIRGQVVPMETHPGGTCDLWERISLALGTSEKMEGR